MRKDTHTHATFVIDGLGYIICQQVTLIFDSMCGGRE